MHRNHGPSNIEAEHLLPTQVGMSEIGNLGPQHGNPSHAEAEFTVEEQSPTELSGTNSAELPMMVREANGGQVVYKVYKRRWFGLTQLVLLNIVVSWDVREILNQLNALRTFVSLHWLNLAPPSGYLSPPLPIQLQPISPQHLAGLIG